MFQSPFINDYLKSPFLWWGIFMLLFTMFHSSLIINLTLQRIVVYQLYIPILFISLTIAFTFSLYPIRQGLRKLSMKKETKNHAIIFLILIGGIFLIEGIFFLVSPYSIFGTLSHEVITDETFWNYSVNSTTLAGFFAIPILQAHIFSTIKKTLNKEGFEINDKFKNNYKFVLYVVFINLVMVSIALLASFSWS